MERSFPHFIIAGAPKAGTTSLYNYLAQHPSIFMSKRKEPVFFCGLPPNFTGPGSHAFNRDLITNKVDYIALFKDATDNMITGEASTDYLSCPEAPIRIKVWNPNTKIIIILRNPIERAFSEHMYLVRDRLEKFTFMEALKLEDERIKNGYIPLFWHVKRGLYYESVKRYLDLFSPSMVKMLIYDKVFSDPEKSVVDAFHFLNVQSVRVDTSKRMKISGIPKWGLLQELYRGYRSSDSDSIIKKIARIVSPSAMRQKTQDLYLRKNIVRSTKIKEEDHEYLSYIFRSDIEQLSNLLETDLTYWLSVSDKSTN